MIRGASSHFMVQLGRSGEKAERLAGKERSTERTRKGVARFKSDANTASSALSCLDGS
jgi:hypothetical protein